jgi:phenylacetate-CoA ligase
MPLERLRRFGLSKGPRDVDRALRFVMRSASANIPVYRRLLEEAGVAAERFRGLEDLPKLPVVRRETLMRDGPLGSRIHRRADPGRLATSLTSGTDGAPVRILMTRTEAFFRKLLLVTAWREALPLRFPQTVIDVGVRSGLGREPEVRWHGPIHLVRVPLPLIRTLEPGVLVRFRRAILAGYPSSLVLLAERLGDASAFLSAKAVATRGEILHAETRARLEAAFRCEVVDFYNCEEIGNVAWQCRADASRLHVNTDACVVEVVDPSGAPLPVGEEGRILVTSLYNCTMPLIRYDLRDRGLLLSSYGDPCPCGCTAPSMGILQGRDDDFVTLTSGARASPREMATVLEQAADGIRTGDFQDMPFKGYQIVQDEPDHVTVRVVPARAGDARLIQPIVDAFQIVDPGMRCTVELTEDLPAAASGKRRKVLSRVVGSA